jgi:hypothetical protein
MTRLLAALLLSLMASIAQGQECGIDHCIECDSSERLTCTSG